ncbi:GntR family transcriptional regulator [Aquincola sp. MAHUQ-54]|uniref:GntR family transcriptional regulator n=1 Tax=Aquincola agrisoli TaxID=3119538 RepID=A0AAW9Q906_9BURK
MPARLLAIEAVPDLVERVHRALLDAIVDGSLAPMARLTQEDIARQLNVSRQPVLQALRQLKAEGLAVDAPGRGLLVAPLDGDWIVAVYQVRAALDVLAARLAAMQHAVIDRGLIDRGRTAARGRDVRRMIEADAAFHAAIYAASGNPLIEPSANVHWRHIRRAMGAVLQKSTLRLAVWDEHEAIAQAIGRGDADTAAGLMAGHAHRASEHMQLKLGGASTAPADVVVQGASR